MTPEQQARRNIDQMLEATGWRIYDYAERAAAEGLGVAIREYRLNSAEKADYLLFVDGIAVGLLEAKKAGTTLSGASQQSERYRANLPEALPIFSGCPFEYQSTGVETCFRDTRDPEPRSRPLFTFHTPEALRREIVEPTTFRYRLKNDIPPLENGNLRNCQLEAITNLEKSLAEARTRALIQMATGSGKTYAAVTATYRLIQFARAKRILFLVDRSNLGRQTLREFQAYTAPDDGRKFTELYNVQHLTSNVIDPTSQVCITTIQRLYSMLKSETEYDTTSEEKSAFENDTETEPPSLLNYNPHIPIDTFDIVIVDECHRSIYGKWRRVLEYFDAFIVGLTATPYKQTLAFFNQNLVSEYRHQQAIADNVNVGYYVYSIRTKITQAGSNIEAGHYVQKRNRETRQINWAELDADVEYHETQLDRDVVSVNQIRTVIQTFKAKLFTDIFPDRTVVPKTIIFAKDDSHAEDIVHIVREEFAKGNDFCQKITYQSDKPEARIAKFRTDPRFRVAVSVDMIATGTDIKPLECLLFMRAVRSNGYFEQMKGRGTRTISTDDLQAVTGDATQKTHFFIVDAVGVCDAEKTDSQPLEHQPKQTKTATRQTEQLIDDISEDEVISAGLKPQTAEQVVSQLNRFKQFIQQNREQLPALRILCNSHNAQGTLTEQTIKELEDALKQPPYVLTVKNLWAAYARKTPASVTGNGTQPNDIISLIRFATGENFYLEPFAATVNQRFEDWISTQTFTEEQHTWLEMIREHIAISLDIRIDDFEYAPFAARGNGAKVYQLFGHELETILKDLTQQLVS